MEKRFEGVIFDFDGTLADTLPGIHSAWQQTFAALELGPITLEKVRSTIGPTKDAYLRLILEDKFESHGEKALEVFRLFYKTECIFKTVLYPGIPELLDLLDGIGIRMGIASNKPFNQVMKLVEHFKLADCFSPILGPEKVKEGKPSPDMFLECARDWDLPVDRLLVVGDTELDMIAGRHAGIARAAVLWGYSERKTLVDQGPEYIVVSPSLLGDIIMKTPAPAEAGK